MESAYQKARTLNGHAASAPALLAAALRQELRRVGPRKSSRAMDIVLMCERAAAAGMRDTALFELAASFVEAKASQAQQHHQGETLRKAVQRLRGGQFSLMDNRALVLLLRHSARQRKHGLQNHHQPVISNHSISRAQR